MALTVTYDRVADAVYVYLAPSRPGSVKRSESVETEMAETALIVEFEADDRVHGVEILGASRLLHPDTLRWLSAESTDYAVLPVEPE